MDRISRRTFIGAAGALAATAGAGSFNRANAAVRATTQTALPSPASSGIEHIVFLCMENRSFDHFLGWVPGADGMQAGLSYPDNNGVLHPTWHLDTWQGCGYNDPSHSYSGGRVQLDGGKCDGFRKGSNDDFAIGYYTKDQLPTSKAIVRGYTIFDGWFAGILGPTYPNRFYTHAAATDRISNTTTTSTLPTIWDRLAAKDIPANYYYSDIPFLALWGDKYASISLKIEQFYAQAASGTLPAFSYLDPSFIGEDQGGSNDDHPHADIRRGQALISQVANAVMNGPSWSSTVLIVTYDEWGGFFDHVPPPTLPDQFTPTATEEHNTAGFRVPTYVISPFAPRHRVAHGTYNHASMLKLVEWRYGLKKLTPRDLNSRNPARALNFAAPPNLTPAPIPAVADPGPHACTAGTKGMKNEDAFWHELAAKSAVQSFG